MLASSSKIIVDEWMNAVNVTMYVSEIDVIEIWM